MSQERREDMTRRATNGREVASPRGIDGRPFTPPPGWPKDVVIYPALTVFHVEQVHTGWNRVVMLNAKEATKYGWEKSRTGGVAMVRPFADSRFQFRG